LVVPYNVESARSAWPTGLQKGHLVRFSTGFEAVHDLIADLSHSLHQCLNFEGC